MTSSNEPVLGKIRTFRNADTKAVFILNYHRVGTVEPNNSFHRLHTVSPRLFKKQIKFLSLFGKFVSLDEIRSYRELGKINFAITFDDVSASVLSIAPYLEDESIPYAICPCTDITSSGLGPRDYVYFILNHLSKKEIFEFVKEQIGDEYPIDEHDFSFYQFTKSPDVDPIAIKEKLVDPLFRRISDRPEVLNELNNPEKAYLDWDDIRKHFLGKSLVTLVNHSEAHDDMTKLTREQISQDVKNSTEIFEKELNIHPDYFAVPFGLITKELAIDLDDSLRAHDYQGALWVAGGINVLQAPYPSQVMHLSRIHTPTTLIESVKRLLLTPKTLHSRMIDSIRLQT